MALWVLIALLLSSVPGRAQEDFNFMPKGGKTLLTELTSNPTELREIASARRSEAEWREFVVKRKSAMAERDVKELAAYLAINMPLPGGAPAEGQDSRAMAATFPPDGRELAWFQCQSCHSLFSGYLMHDRDAQGWRSIFLSPFHRGMKMTERERETFARYSGHSMPMKIENVPADLRF
jgi:hypothetical protein